MAQQLPHVEDPRPAPKPASEASVTGDGGRGTERSARSARTRARILDAAEQIFGRRGYHDASIVDITQAAGVASGTFYVHFGSKMELFRELVQARRAELQDVAREAAYKHEGGRELVHAGFKAWFDWVTKHPSILRVMREAEFVESSLVEDLYRVHAREQADGLQHSIDAGRIDPIDPEVVAWCLVGMAETIALRWIVWEGGKPMPPDRLDAFVDTALRAMRFPASDAEPNET